MFDRHARRRLGVLFALTCACSEPVAATTDAGSTGEPGTTSGSTTSGAPVTTTSTAGTTDAPTTTGDSSTGDPGFDPPAAVCGNGYLEGDEECDDGNDVADDGCGVDCLIPCGLATEVTVLAPTAESDLWVVAIASAPDGGFVAVARHREIISDQEGTQTIGLARTRVLRYDVDAAPVWDVMLAPADVRLGAVAGVVDGDGDIYVAGTLAGDDGDDIRVLKLAGADGHVLWTMDHDGAAPMSDDVAAGLALAPDGDVIIAGTVSDVAADSDVWVRKLTASDGSEVWTTTWTGVGNGQYSTDIAGRLAVGADGTVYVGGREYVEYNIAEAVLLKFAPDGGPAEWVFSPLADGSAHLHGPGWVGVDGAGDVLYTAVRQSGAVANFWLYKVSADNSVVWERGLADFEDIEAGDEWSLNGARFDAGGGVVLAGGFRVKDKLAQLAWREAWVARLGADGVTRCRIHHRAASSELVPPSTYALDVAIGADATAYVGGQLIQAGEQQLWVGLFRP